MTGGLEDRPSRIAPPAVAPLWIGSLLALVSAAVCAYWVHDRWHVGLGSPELFWTSLTGTVWTAYALLSIGTAIVSHLRPIDARAWRRVLAVLPLLGVAGFFVVGAQIPMGAGLVVCWLPALFLGLVYVLLGLWGTSPRVAPSPAPPP